LFRRLLAGVSGHPRAVALILLSTCCVAMMQAAVRLVADQGLHPFEIAFFRNLFGLFVLAPWFARYGLAPLRTGKLGLHALRGGLNAASMLVFFTGLSLTPLAQAAALTFTTPLFVTIGAALLLGERVRARRWLAIAAGFAGMLIILRPGVGQVEIGSLLILASTVLWSLAVIDIKVLSRTESSVTITLYMGLFLTPLTLIAALFVWRVPTVAELGWLAFIGLFGTAAQMTMTQALKEADSSALTPFDFTRLIWMAVLGYLVFGEVPTIWTWIGGAIIFLSATFIAYREAQLRVAAGKTAETNLQVSGD
jgi:drug/metabolite transporter (DMT)-like permease